MHTELFDCNSKVEHFLDNSLLYPSFVNFKRYFSDNIYQIILIFQVTINLLINTWGIYYLLLLGGAIIRGRRL